MSVELFFPAARDGWPCSFYSRSFVYRLIVNDWNRLLIGKCECGRRSASGGVSLDPAKLVEPDRVFERVFAEVSEVLVRRFKKKKNSPGCSDVCSMSTCEWKWA